MSAITPTRAGEGKTTTTIGLGQAMAKRGASVSIALREPSLGPCMGMKGGATGGGHSQVIPMESINLHFTGDFHAITSAHNLVAAIVDNRLHFESEPRLDSRRVIWKRVLDMNDRSLRNLVVGLGGVGQGVARESGFDITAASEVMAMLCLANGRQDLRDRLDRSLVGFTPKRKPVTVANLEIGGALMALLHEALQPNLVQTLEGTPAIVHGGPFANIAHGCNSVMATKMASHLAEWTVTEAGFGFDLGGEKFLDIKCPTAGLNPAGIVLVATVRALKLHGGVPYDQLNEPDPDAVQAGLPNLEKHIDSARCFGKPVVVALNQFTTDTDDEVAVVRAACERAGVPFAPSNHHAHGGDGALGLADAVMEACSGEAQPHRPLYDPSDSVEEKIHTVATKMYGAREVVLTQQAQKSLRRIEKLGYENLPVCIAKTQSSLSDDPKRLGRPEDFDLTVRDLYIQSGAGFIVVMTGDILRMPGLPRTPAAESIDVVDGKITGLS